MLGKRPTDIVGMEDPGQVQDPIVAAQLQTLQENILRLDERARDKGDKAVAATAKPTQLPKFHAGEGIRIVQTPRQVTIATTTQPITSLAMMTAISEKSDYLVCTLNGKQVNVYKPWFLQRSTSDGQTIDGVQYNFTGAGTRTATDGDIQETQCITPSYIDGEQLIAAKLDGAWYDLNTAGRTWGKGLSGDAAQFHFAIIHSDSAVSTNPAMVLCDIYATEMGSESERTGMWAGPMLTRQSCYSQGGLLRTGSLVGAWFHDGCWHVDVLIKTPLWSSIPVNTVGISGGWPSSGDEYLPLIEATAIRDSGGWDSALMLVHAYGKTCWWHIPHTNYCQAWWCANAEDRAMLETAYNPIPAGASIYPYAEQTWSGVYTGGGHGGPTLRYRVTT